MGALRMVESPERGVVISSRSTRVRGGCTYLEGWRRGATLRRRMGALRQGGDLMRPISGGTRQGFQEKGRGSCSARILTLMGVRS